MTVEERRAALHDKAARLAFRHYLCSGRVPLEVREVLAATESLAALEKYDPNQPRVPRGSPEGGRWTDDDRWFDPANPPGVFGLAPIDDKPLEHVYVVEAVALLAVWQVVAAVRIVAGLVAPLRARVASARRINQAARAIEQYLGGKPDKAFPNHAGDMVLMKGDKKIRFDIKNPGNDKPHFHAQKRSPSNKWVDAGGKHRHYFREGE